MLLVDRKTISMKITSSILLLFIGISSYAQDCDCLTELRFLAEQAQEAPSMKSQRRSMLGKLAFIAEIEEDMERDENIDLNCLYYLQRYLKVVKDEHMYVADLGNTKDYAALTPVYEESPEALTSNAVTTKDDPITGIYDLLTAYRVAVVKVKGKSYDYGGYILESASEDWQAGQLKFTLKIKGDELIGNFYDRKHTPAYKKVALVNGRLYPERWIKEEFAAEYAANNYYIEGDLFQYKDYGRGVHYVRLGSFSGSNENYSQAMDLLKELEQKLMDGEVILDLRNNTGGGERTSDPFLKLFRKRKKKLDFHIVQNVYVGSNAEHFLLKAKKQLDATTYGENTRGALAYGFGNYSTETIKTPCFGYDIGLTSSKYERYLEYEVVGIPPDQYLNSKTDWISQILDKIESK